MVLKSAQKLDTAYDQFIDLHERFLVFRVAEADNHAEEESLKKEGEYILKVQEDCKAIRKLYNKYIKLTEKLKKAKDKKAENLKKANNKIKEIARLANVVETSVQELDSIKNRAMIVVNSEDKKIQASAEEVI